MEKRNSTIYLGSGTNDAKFYFKGTPSVRINGGGVNEVIGMTISIAPSTAIGTTAL